MGDVVLTMIVDQHGKEQIRAADITRVFPLRQGAKGHGLVELTVKLAVFDDFPSSDFGPTFFSGTSSAHYVETVDELTPHSWTYRRPDAPAERPAVADLAGWLAAYDEAAADTSEQSLKACTNNLVAAVRRLVNGA